MYWLIAGLILLAGLLSQSEAIFLPSIFTATAAFTISLLLAEFALRYITANMDYMLISIGFVFAIVVMLTFGSQISGLYIALDIPIIVSILYFSRSRLWFGSVLSLGCYFIMYSFVEPLRQQVNPNDFVAIIGMIIGTSLIGQMILRKAEELKAALERAVRSEVEAFADSIAVENQSKYDHLTGLTNYVTFQDYVVSIIEQHERYGLPLCLAVLDLDNFKTINDTFGHYEGDRVLRETAKLLLAAISSEDVAVRYGGEEFVLILTGKTMDESLQLLEQIRVQISQLRWDSIDNHKITVSTGIVQYRKGMGKEDLFRSADSLMYEAKRLGKNRIQFLRNGVSSYDPNISE
ncbi:GGDEF domain-containing protein [Paenibacillus wynnii]|uniref:GGDEF domain-containing protein n=1 Tax=Paenibacillus wynnii TaxID=268407 RepID=UPI002794B936|nr:GGDEF domain-containing protein [Paenibacillus wynnii]MDQ0195204.1 diguanylate cyclase (GGDEF)-like protein [Paenibacillus wynnii]